MSDLTHLVIARAAGEDAESESIELRLGFSKEPDTADLEQLLENLKVQYEAIFERPCARSGLGILPWVDEVDDPDDMTQADVEDSLYERYIPFNEPMDD